MNPDQPSPNAGKKHRNDETGLLKNVKTLLTEPAHQDNPLREPLARLLAFSEEQQRKTESLIKISERSQSTPAVTANWDQGCLIMQGDSYPENSFEFFAQIIAWIEHYLKAKEPSAPLRLELRLLYMNTSSVKAMMDIFDRLEEAHKQGRPISVNWYYNPHNRRIVNLADEFREDCSFPFEIVAHEH